MRNENHHFANIDRNNIKCISICRISIEFGSNELENWIQTGDVNVFLCSSASYSYGSDKPNKYHYNLH